MRLLRSLLLGAVLLTSALPVAADPVPGWKRFELPETGSYYWRYLPAGLELSQPVPAVLFFHGSGGIPDKYRAFLVNAADRAGQVLILPKSSTNQGWGTEEDELITEESLRAVRSELPLDPRRISVAGHSAGGAWAYLLAYQTDTGYAAVFSMAAPFYQVDSLADPSYKAPIRMYYGSADPNYTGGSYAALKMQWQRLGVPFEEEVLPGFGHNTLPASAVENGFLFLAGKSHPAGIGGCVPGPAVLCLGDGRYQVEVTWRDFQGGSGVGSVVPGAVSNDSGLFWFFAPANWELLVKVLDGCAINGHRWVFAAATTTVDYTLKVTDTETEDIWTWRNAPGRPAPAVTDTAALVCTP